MPSTGPNKNPKSLCPSEIFVVSCKVSLSVFPSWEGFHLGYSAPGLGLLEMLSLNQECLRSRTQEPGHQADCAAGKTRLQGETFSSAFWKALRHFKQQLS